MTFSGSIRYILFSVSFSYNFVVEYPSMIWRKRRKLPIGNYALYCVEYVCKLKLMSARFKHEINSIMTNYSYHRLFLSVLSNSFVCNK